jgi:hypothetical protein
VANARERQGGATLVLFDSAKVDGVLTLQADGTYTFIPWEG